MGSAQRAPSCQPSTAPLSCLCIFAGETCIQSPLYHPKPSCLPCSPPSTHSRPQDPRQPVFCLLVFAFSFEHSPAMGLLLSVLKTQSKYFSDFIKHLLSPVFNFSPHLPELCLTSWPLPAGPLTQCGAALGSQSASLPGWGTPPPHPTPPHPSLPSVTQSGTDGARRSHRWLCPPSPILRMGS